MSHYNPDRIWRGRSYKNGEAAADCRESGATRRAKETIREARERSAREADLRSAE